MKRKLLSVAVLLGVCAVAAGGFHLLTTARHSAGQHSGESAAANPDKEHVALTEAKMAGAGIQVASVESRSLQPIRTVPGRIEYNATRHVAVKSPADGLVRKIAVIVGDRVDGGQLLAVVNSPELGERRADVLKQQAELELARRERDWWRSVQTNLGDLRSL